MNQHSKAIRKAAKAWEANAEKYRNNDEGMFRAYHADARDLEMLAKLIDTGELKTAFGLACCLDTIVRDLIPNKQWKYLETV